MPAKRTAKALKTPAPQATVTLSMSAGPPTLHTVGDVYRKASTTDVKVATLDLLRTKAAELGLDPGRYYYAFDVFDGTGSFTLTATRQATELATRTYTSPPTSGNVFDFSVT
jgi:hypothetical protein